MRTLALSALLAAAASLASCATAPAPLPVAAGGVCGTYGYVDVNNDGMISGDEWNRYRAGAFGYWDTDGDGRVERDEFERCWAAGGFYPASNYSPAHWTHYWTVFDANGDGYLTSDEYWSAAAWARIDANRNGIIDASEWSWWGS